MQNGTILNTAPFDSLNHRLWRMNNIFKQVNLSNKYMEKELSQGAEATITFDGNIVRKTRTEKSYRLKELDDKLRSSRTKREKKVFDKLAELDIPTPKLLNVDKFVLEMEFIDGVRFRDKLIENSSFGDNFKIVGEWLAKMHESGIIHGDLTSSNVLVDKNNKLFLIDFGLSFFSHKDEDKAVDIHLLEQAIKSTHYQDAEMFFNKFKEGYSKSANSISVLDRLKEVNKRGRNKH